MPTPNASQAQAFKSPIMSLPEEPVYVPITFDFTTDAAQVVTKEFAQEFQNLKIPFIQCAYIDNSGDANALTLSFNDGLFSVTVKGRTQGWYAVCVAEGIMRVTATSTASAIKKNVIFTSMMVPPQVWATQ
jgi:hypothetical protein